MNRIFSLVTKLIFSLSTKKTKYSYSPLAMSQEKRQREPSTTNDNLSLTTKKCDVLS
jgi:hypothetical protein